MTDIEDSTWLWEHHPDSMEAVVSDHNAIVAVGVSNGNGRLVKSTGDGALALFGDAYDAVVSAVEIQRQFVARGWPGVGEVQVRIGLDTGACRMVDGDVLGRPPNLAARLQAAGHGGQILTSGATAAACADRLADDGIEFEEIGPYLIRGFDEPISVHMVTAERLPTRFPPLRAQQVGADDFPPDDGEIFGRDDLLAAIPKWLEVHRVVTLWGPTGVGKSRIATRVGRTARRPFDHGVRFVDLSRKTSDDPVRAIVGALHAQPVAGEPPQETALRTLRPLRVLLVVLHCERVIDELRPLINAVEEQCPNVRVLTSSREILGCAGERAVEVRPLQVPRNETVSANDLVGYPSACLFESRLAELQPGFRVHPSNAELVARACRAADGLPLALELAAAAASLEGLSVPPSVAASLAARVTEQIGRLDPADAALLARLAVFDGPFSRETAVEVSRSPGMATGLDRLVRRALVQVETTEHDRFRLLRPCRHVAWMTLSPPVQAAVRARHAQVMVERAARFAPMMRTNREAEAVRGIGSGFAEFRGAFRHLLATGAVGDAARLVTSLFQFCLFQPRPEGHQWAIEVTSQVSGDDPVDVELLGAAALASWFAGDMANAAEFGRRSLDAAATAGGSTVWALTAVVNALGYIGDLDGIAPHFIALVRELRSSEEPYWKIDSLAHEAISLAMFGRDADAVAKAELAIDLARDLGNPDGTHWALYALGRASAREDPHAASEAYELAMAAALEVDSKFNASLDLAAWVGVQRRIGESWLAVRGASDLLELVAVSGNRAQLSEAILETGLVLAHAGRAEPAAIALLSRRRLPTMPTGAHESGDADCLAQLAAELGTTWSRVRVRARALSEPDLVDLCRNALANLASSRA